jgi:YidC/Oxa1 family membrane protein insertase
MQHRALAYLGPKVPSDLSAAGHAISESVQTGWFSGLAVGLTWLLREFHALLGNWGIAIIVLTFVVKTVLFPLTWKQVQSMAKMKALKPEIDRINEMYPDDREKKGAAMMELYRKKGINPMAGCFPVLLQLPIWFSLYQSLATNVELFRAPFALWWQDLSGPDPYFVLPLALGVLMFVQQKITPVTGMDPVQAKMMLYFMPAMITAFMLFLPAGLCLYMFTNSALSIVQQRVIETQVNRRARVDEAPVAGAVADSLAPTGDDPGANQPSSKRRSRRGRT